ncbi:hypothetical protein AAVH_15583, partial [Aphelenchoides avenae]
MLTSSSVMYALLATVLMVSLTATNGAPAELSMTEFAELCAYFPDALHCPGMSIDKRATDGLARKLMLVQQFQAGKAVKEVNRKNPFV